LRRSFRRFRNRLLASPRFQNFATSFPLMRPVARRQSRALFDLVAGFTYSQVLFACVKLDLFALVGQTEATADAIAAKIGWTPARARLLLDAAAAIDLLERDGDAYALGWHGAALLAQPWIGRFIAHHDQFYADLENPMALLAGTSPPGRLRAFWRYDTVTEGQDTYTALMAASQAAVSREVLGAYDFRRHRLLLDVGGGDGSFLRAVAAKHPQLSLALFDLPGVIEIARGTFGPKPVSLHGGSFRRDPLPHGADAVSLIRVVHDHDDEVVLELFRSIRAILPAHGTLIVAEPLSGSASTAPVTDAYFNLYFAAMGSGRTRTPQEIAALAKMAGFSRCQQQPTSMPLITGVLVLKI
jgi:demethylspheroidene O-methyltransferase